MGCLTTMTEKLTRIFNCEEQSKYYQQKAAEAEAQEKWQLAKLYREVATDWADEAQSIKKTR